MTGEGYDPFKFGEVKLEDQKAAAEARKAAGESIPEDLLFAERGQAGPGDAPVKPLTEQPVPKDYRPPPPRGAQPTRGDDSWAPLQESVEDLPRGKRDSTLAHLFDKPGGAGSPSGIMSPGAMPPDTQASARRRNPLPPARSRPEPGAEDARRERPSSDRQRVAPDPERQARREPLPRASDRPSHPSLDRVQPKPRMVPALILLGGLGAGSFFCFVMQNYPVAIFLALVSIVAAPLARLVLNSSQG